MSDLVTLSSLRDSVRRRADQEYSTFVTDAEVNSYINESIKALWDLVLTANRDYVVTQTSFTLSNGSGAYTLPANFYKIRGLDRDLGGGNRLEIPMFVFEERNRRRNYEMSYSTTDPYLFEFQDLAYRVIGQQLIIEPPSKADGTYILWYIPVPAALTIDADTFDGTHGWQEFVVIDSAIKCLRKEDSSTTALEGDLEVVKRRILANSSRSVGHPEVISRVRGGVGSGETWG